MGLDPRIEQIRQAAARRPDLTRTHFMRSYGVGAKKFNEWIDAGLLDIPVKKLSLRGADFLFKRTKR